MWRSCAMRAGRTRDDQSHVAPDSRKHELGKLPSQQKRNVAQGGVELSSGLRRVRQLATRRQVARKKSHAATDARVATLVAAHRVSVGCSDHPRHHFLGKAELEPNALQLFPGQPREPTGLWSARQGEAVNLVAKAPL